MKTFKYFITENSNILEAFAEDHDFSALKPHHSYKTKDNHHIDVHVFNDKNGKHAVFKNKNLNSITKLVHWSHDSEFPSKSELEKINADPDEKEDNKINEQIILEELLPDSAGKIAEHSAVMHMIGHMHAQNKTYGSPEHKKQIAPHKKAISELGKGHDPQVVNLRVKHGEAMANAALESLKLKHGPGMKIVDVGHTSKPGDIERFTKGRHKDTQDNPSDMVVKVKASKKINESEDDDHHYEGFSLKSSAKAKNITVKNPAVHFHGELDHPTRKLDTEKISRDGLKKLRNDMGHGDKSAAERGRLIDSVRKKENVPNRSSIEKKASDLGRKVNSDISSEFHNHLKHLTTKTGDEGHHKIGQLLKKHLTPETSMSYSKIHAKGDHPHKIKAVVTPGSDSPLHKVFNNKKTKYSVTRNKNSSTVSIHKVEKDGSHTTLANYTPKTNSNALKSDVHNWVVTPANTHSS
jgi:hypothetical protein